jgi:hypothetical protein
MNHSHVLRRLMLSMVIAAASAAIPAAAQVTFQINIAPPSPMYEVTPVLAPGYIWVPGYWAWNVDRHIWIRGRTIVQRVGYRWEPDRWEQRGQVYYRHPGRWQHDAGYQVIQLKKAKKDKHWENKMRNDDRDDWRKHGKGNKHKN